MNGKKKKPLGNFFQARCPQKRTFQGEGDKMLSSNTFLLRKNFSNERGNTF